MFVYLDNGATTKPYKEVTAQMFRCMETDYGNPSSLHRMGIFAEKILKQSRKAVALSLSVHDEEIYFTSGGTEADNMALLGAAHAMKRRGNKIITSQIEHPAVLESCKKLETMGFCVDYLPVDKNGVIQIADLENVIDEQTVLISIMRVNNEVGSIQPLVEIGALKKQAMKKIGREILLHSDSIQSYGKMPAQIAESGIDLLSVSGHKIHGPKGVGALFIRNGLNVQSYLHGGGQERGMRPGTENVPAIAGLGAAAEISHKGLCERIEVIKAVKTYLSKGIEAEINDIRFNGSENCSPSILNISFLGLRGEVLLHTLEQSDIYVSTGAACASNKKGQSHVLKAMGLTNEEIEGAIRFSFCEFNTINEMDYVLAQLKNAVNKIRKLGSYR